MEAVDIVINIITVLLGTFIAIFHKLLGDLTVEFYSKLLGIKYRKFDRKVTELVYLVGGFAFIIFGALGVVQTVR